MAIVTYNEDGEILGVYYTPPSDMKELPEYIKVDNDTAARIFAASYRYRIVDGEVVHTPPEPTPLPPSRLKESDLVAGVMVDGVCYATTAIALSLLSASVATGSPKALVHLKDGDAFVEVDADTAKAIVEAAFNKAVAVLTR